MCVCVEDECKGRVRGTGCMCRGREGRCVE